MLPDTLQAHAGQSENTQTQIIICRKRGSAFYRRFPVAGPPHTTDFRWVLVGLLNDLGSEEYSFMCPSFMCLFGALAGPQWIRAIFMYEPLKPNPDKDSGDLEPYTSVGSSNSRPYGWPTGTVRALIQKPFRSGQGP